MRAPRRGLRIVLFAGAGGSCTGIRAALGEEPDVAINHDELALRVHKANHPKTRHLTEDVWETPPLKVTGGRPVELLWASPDCTHFSVAKGGKPRQKNIRSLAWVVRDWARDVKPRCIFLENVREFLDWGPLYEAGHVLADGRVLEEGDALLGRPIPERKGETFQQWRGALELLGYVVDVRVLDASLYGAPTKRRRLFLVARCDGQPIRWPEPTHGPGRLALHAAAECIDWSLPCPSIFGRKKPLAEKTLFRIAEGIRRFVLENPAPFILRTAHGDVGKDGKRRGRGSHAVGEPLPTVTASKDFAIVSPSLIQTGYGERVGQAARVLNLHEPLGTVMATGQKHALVAAYLLKHFGGVVGVPFDGRPMDTITATDHHSLAAVTLATFRGTSPGQPMSASVEDPLPVISAGGIHVAEVRAFLTTYYGEGSSGQKVDAPMRTITALARLGLVLVEGVEHQIVDIGMRMLEPHELLAAQFGRFAAGYDLSAATSKAAKVRLIGNSVCPEVAEALVRANLGEDAALRRAA
jgi:DNA (cytosine-5)-methyltransferase 1